MRNVLFICCLFVFISCGKDGSNGAAGADGSSTFGINGVSTGIEFEDISPGLACAAGGVSIFSFRDSNADGVLQSDESVIKVKSICNGSNGANGINGANGASASITLESVASSFTCPNGGVKISSTNSSSVEVCNGINGINGEQGIPGMQGIPGIAGAVGAAGADGQDGQDGQDGNSGTIVTPVKFCASDKSTFPEYGLMIGNDLFAVYWGSTPASPKVSQAFLTKLVPGNYMSTGGNNCLFSIR